MHKLRVRSLIVLVLFGLFGVGCYLTTRSTHDSRATPNELFTLSWAFSGIGLAIVAAVIFLVASGKDSDYTSQSRLYAMTEMTAIWVIVSAVVMAIIMALICNNVGGHTLGDGTTVRGVFDGERFVAVYFGLLAGEVLGFLGLLVLTGEESWKHNAAEANLAAARVSHELDLGVHRG